MTRASIDNLNTMLTEEDSQCPFEFSAVIALHDLGRAQMHSPGKHNFDNLLASFARHGAGHRVLAKMISKMADPFEFPIRISTHVYQIDLNPAPENILYNNFERSL